MVAFLCDQNVNASTHAATYGIQVTNTGLKVASHKSSSDTSKVLKYSKQKPAFRKKTLFVSVENLLKVCWKLNCKVAQHKNVFFSG